MVVSIFDFEIVRLEAVDGTAYTITASASLCDADVKELARQRFGIQFLRVVWRKPAVKRSY